ncbi:DivIVA domain-containing protein [Corynebacterium sp. ES2794-CONJ1]|uniref:DivIVA domain-containing protein n=1 Tax=unclassified Corynebacterium TaxID=2624378 RepID=UPI0021695D09|nr:MULTISPECIES: DivIVA domain-containing protein [unclassified Corynebacterium]MCS4489062.1 DivIVA domain-containing protein [Corynebacterium sp. ES2775-CONJ]MCS4490875.1 DivIVA domain-containing protein [Corynebacterium sp. ES2715-CONJ3]MCS4531242.1 DivIVA domain-containing protein [Corynebacterium sp. ES2730-CONJ]MCU9518611.1 DivIVA domain-containing protein [Corynebacterium sp. ES2794-CONJ1]
MYRVFQSLDELVRNVEQAYGVPMTANCMVPRNEMLALLDDLRNALPIEIDDAQDVIDQKDEIIGQAQIEAQNLVDDAREEAHSMMSHAQSDSEAMLADAENRAHATVARAQDEADALLESSRREAESTVERAGIEAKRLIDSGNDQYQRSIDEGLAEQQRLVSESEVVRRANEEAHRIVDAAHADSNRLRTECDQFVDSKLAEFEEALSATLRVVSKDRSALRSGAGASGGARYSK